MSDQPPASRGDPQVSHGGVMDDVDRRILEYVACHPVVLVSQIQALLDVGESLATERLDALIAQGLIRHGPRLRDQQAGYQITASGLREIGSDLPVPRVDLRRYWHDVGVAWLWLAARKGRFGEVERVYGERELRAADQKPTVAPLTIDPGWSPAVRAKVADSSFGLRLDGDGSTSLGRPHYRDLVLVIPQGRVALEFQLTLAGRQPLEAILAAYGRKASIAVVLYLVQDGAIGDVVQAAAARLGLARQVHVQHARLGLAAH
jgi:hypothetical protein